MPEGLYAWDVRRLIELSRALPVEQVPLTEIAELDRNHWYNHLVPTPRSMLEHFSLIQACDLRYPVILDAAGRLMDGMHRVCRALLEERSHISTQRFVVDPEPDYIGLGPEEVPYEPWPAPGE